ncbi:transposase [Psychrobacillus sp. OK028]|uniref:transposase n=1 Tax=Psychrobacillus sp. OK028 TaxID=1884359 RepID=UPI0008906F41|nr:transposase [Psychrobacillus sp. OK028]SDO35265.1 transposase [Psychrobacillus sp. OK028]
MAVLSREMREYLVKLVVEDGRKASELAYEYGVKPERIRDWVRVYKQKQTLLSDGELSSSMELKRRIAELEKKEKELKEENEILKKAMHVFAKNHT